MYKRKGFGLKVLSSLGRLVQSPLMISPVLHDEPAFGTDRKGFDFLIREDPLDLCYPCALFFASVFRSLILPNFVWGETKCN